MNYIFSLFAPPIRGSYQLLRYNFLFDHQQESLLKFVVFIQFLGMVLFIIYWLKNKKNIKSDLLFWFILLLALIFICITFLVFYFILFLSLGFF